MACAGGIIHVPMAMVDIQCPLQRDVLLGHDLDENCGEMIQKQMFVLTRAQEEEQIQERKQEEEELLQFTGKLMQIGLDNEDTEVGPDNEETEVGLDKVEQNEIR